MGDKSIEQVVEGHTVQLAFLVGAITKIEGYMKEIATTQSDLKILVERQIAHEEANHTEHKHIHERINRIEKDCEEMRENHNDKCDRISQKAEKGFVAYTVLKWAGGIIGALMLATMMARIFGIKGG